MGDFGHTPSGRGGFSAQVRFKSLVVVSNTSVFSPACTPNPTRATLKP
jgi:hypothetical protein